MTVQVVVDCDRIMDRDSFHDEFARVFGFPEFYGRNGDAWIDCMGSLDENFSHVQVKPSQIVVVQLNGAAALQKRCPELVTAILEWSAFANWRRVDRGEQAILSISAEV